MKIRKGFITAVFIVLLTVLAIFPAQSEAVPYGSIVVSAGGFTVDGGASQPLANLAPYLAATNTIGILSFGDGIVGTITVYADITTSLTVGTGSNVTLNGTAATTGANVSVNGTLNGTLATGTGFVKVNSGGVINGNVSTTTGPVTVDTAGAINGSIGNASMTGNVQVNSGGTLNSGGAVPSISTTGTVSILGGDVSNRKIFDAQSVTISSGGSVLSTGQYAIDSTSGNVKVEESEITALMRAITGTGGNVTVEDSEITVGVWPAPYQGVIQDTAGDVILSGSILTNLNANGIGILDTDGDVLISKSQIDVLGIAIDETGGNVEVTGASSDISGAQGGIDNTGGNVQIGTGVTVDGGAGAAISDTIGTVLVGSDLGGATITGAQGIINTGGDLSVIKSEVTATSGDAINGVSGTSEVKIDRSEITAYGGSGVVVDGAQKVNIDTSVVSADLDGIIARNAGTGGIVIKNTAVTAGGDGIDVSGSAGKVEITDTTIVAGGDGINVSDNSVYGNVINNLDITAGEDGLVAENTSSLTVNLTEDGNINTLSGSGIRAEGSTTNLTINSPNDSRLDLTTGGYGIDLAAGATLNDNVETYITTTGDYSSGVSVRGDDSNANFAKDLYVGIQGDNSIGIETMGGGVVNASQDVYITSDSGSSVRGIFSTGTGSSVTIDGLTEIEIYTDDSKGIEAADGGAVHLNDVNVDMAGSGMMTGLYAAEPGSSINVSGDLDVSVQGETFAGGLYANQGGTITADSVTEIEVSASDGDAYGMWADDGSHINAAFNGLGEESIHVSAVSGDAYGAAATSVTQPSGIVIENAGDIIVAADGGNAYGLYADPSTISGDAENITVTATGDAYGAYAYDSSTIDVEVSDTIDVKSTVAGLAVGIGASDSSYTKITGLDVLAVSATNGTATGIYANAASSADVLMDDGTVTVTSALGSAYGVHAHDNSDITLQNADEIAITAGFIGYGVYAHDNSGFSGDIGSLAVTAVNAGYGIFANLESTADAVMSGDITVIAQGSAYGILADISSDVTVSGLNDLQVASLATGTTATGIGALNNSSADVTMTGDITVGASGPVGRATGVHAYNNSDVSLTGAQKMTVLSVSGDAYGVYSQANSDFSGDIAEIQVTAGGDAAGIAAGEYSSADVSMDGDMIVQALSGDAYGVTAQIGSDVEFTGTKAMYVMSTSTGDAYGVHAFDEGIISGDVESIFVSATSGDAFGTLGEDNSEIDLVLSGDITAQSSASGEAVGIGSATSSDVTVSGLGNLSVSALDQIVGGPMGNATGIGAAENSHVSVSMDGNIRVETKDGDAAGAVALEGSHTELTMSGGDLNLIIQFAGDAVGIGAEGSSDILVTGLKNLDISDTAGDAIGISAANYSSADVSMTGKIDVRATSGDVTGVGAEDNSYAILRMDADKTDNDILVRTNEGNAYGMVASGDSDIVFENVRDLVVTTALGDAYGLFANDPSTISGDVESITVTASGNAYGAYAYSESTIDAAMSGDITVTSATGDAYGIFAETSSDVTITGLQDLTVKVTAASSNYAYGISAEDYSSADVTMTGDILVTTAGTGESIGVAASSGSEIFLLTEGSITAESETGDSYGIAADTESSVTVDGLTDLEVTVLTAGNAYGIDAYDSSTIDVQMSGDITVGTASGDAYGVRADDDSNVYLSGAKAMDVSATSGDAYGLYSTRGSLISGDVEEITATADGYAYGIGADRGGEIRIVLSGDVTAESTAVGAAVGIGADTGGDVFVSGLQDLYATAETGAAMGIGADRGGYAEVEMAGDITAETLTYGDATGIGADRGGDAIVTGLENILVKANQGNAAGLAADDGGYINASMSGDITVRATDGYAYGVFAGDDSEVYLTGAKAMVVSADAGEAYGLYATRGGIISGDVQTIEVTSVSDDAYGIAADRGGDIDIIMSGDVTVTSITVGDAVGVGAETGGDITVYGLGDVTVTADTGDATGIGADRGGYVEAHMNSDMTVESTVSGDVAGIGADHGGDVIVTGLEDMYVDAKSGVATGIGADNGSYVNVAMDGTAYVETEAGPAFGIYADDESEVILTGGDLDVTGTTLVRGLIADDDAIIRMTDGDIAVNDIADSAYMEVNQGGAIYLSGVTANTFEGEIIDEDRTLITTDSYGVLSADMGTVIGGNMIHTGIESGDLDITITGGSKIIGAANVPYYVDSRINITLDSLADTWEVTADSYTNGMLTNRGLVDYQNVESLLDYNDGTEPGDFKTVTVYDFVGNDSSTPEDETGILKMKADINGGLNDLLIADESATGVNRLEIQNLTNSGVERSGTLVLVEDDETDLDLSIANPDEINAFGQYLIHAGPWSYELVSEEPEGITKEWFLERWSLTNTGVGIVSSMVNADVWYREVGTLLNRMGIYRDGDYYGGFWFEAAANKQEMDGGFGSQFDQQFTNFTVGWDKMYEKEKGDLFIGIMGGYGKADRDIGNIGTTDLESTHAALYGIYRTDDGFYATGLVKYNKYDNDMSLTNVDKFSRRILAELGEGSVRGDWDQDGYGISLQIGKRMDRENGWYLEPQAQLSWMRINGESYTTNTGIEVGIDDSDSFRGRLGLLVGRKIQMKDDTKLDVFGSLSLVHEFEGETDITMSGGKWTSDLGGTWGVFGAGFNWNFQPGKYVHGGVSYATGDNRDEPWGVYLGLSIEVGGSRPTAEKTEEAEAEAVTETEPAAETSSEPAAQTGSL